MNVLGLVFKPVGQQSLKYFKLIILNNTFKIICYIQKYRICAAGELIAVYLTFV